MGILTHKMETAIKKYLGESAVIHFPFNEGSGSIVTDQVNGVVVTPSGPTFIEPHAVLTGHSHAAVTSGNFNAPDKTKWIACALYEGGVINQIKIGDSTNGIILDTSNQVGFLGAVTAADTAGTAGTKYFVAAVCDGSTLTHYYGSDTAGSLPMGTVAIGNSVAVANPTLLGLADEISFGLDALKLDVFELAVFAFDSIPAGTNLTDNLQFMADNWRVGRKVLPEAWKSYAQS